MARFDEAAPKVIIIGAGVAGLACFEKLLADGVAREDEILILESRDRPLGRVATSRFAGVPVDVGAAWIHGTDGNPIAARAPPVPLKPVAPANPWTSARLLSDERVFVTCSGGARVSHSMMRRAAETFEELMTSLGKGAAVEAVAKNDADASLGPALHALIDERCSHEADRGAAAQMSRLLGLHVHLMELWMGASADQLQQREFVVHEGESEDERGWGDFRGAHCVPEGGMERVFRFLLEPARPRILFNCAVTSVDWGGEGGVVVTAGGSARFAAERAVIVTVPLGVLQSGAVEWTPELPTRKLEAIRRLKMGHYKKVLLTWRDCWWKQIADAPFIVCVESPAGAAVEPGAADTAVLRSDFTVFYNLHWQLGAPMLEATVAGRDAQLLGRYSDAQIQTAMVARLRASLCGGPADEARAVVPEPDDVHVSTWETDPHARGAYSFWPVGASEDDVAELASPLYAPTGEVPRVIFAGEATDAEGQGSVHGAFASGRRAAGELAPAAALDEEGEPPGLKISP